MTIRSPVSLRVSTTTSLYPGVPNICRSPADRRTVCSCHPVGHVPELGISLSIKGLGVIQICHQPLRVAFVLAAGERKLPQGRIAEKLGCDHSNQNDHSPNQDGWKLACIVSAIGKHDVLLEALNVDSLRVVVHAGIDFRENERRGRGERQLFEHTNIVSRIVNGTSSPRIQAHRCITLYRERGAES